jgi:sulfatase modifying factor 1
MSHCIWKRLTVLAPLLVAGQLAGASDLAHWTFDHPQVGDPVPTAPFVDEVQGLVAVPVTQGASSIYFGEPSVAGGASSLQLNNAGTSNENGSFLRVADLPALTGHSRLSIDVRIKPAELKLGQIVRKTDGNIGYQLYLQADGRIGFRIEDGAGHIGTVLSAPIAAGSWHEVSATWDGMADPPFMSLSVNGSTSTNSSIGALVLQDTANPLSIGALYRNAGSNGQFFNGLIDELTIGSNREGYTNSLGMRMIRIPGGSFSMGSADGDFDEQPVRTVTVAGFHMAQTEVTNAQFEEFMPSHASYRAMQGGLFGGDDHPVTHVTWQEAVDFCAWLSGREGRTYRLATEAEWEYAARAGTTTAYFTGATLPGGFPRNAITAGSGPQNAWGLQEMHGNVEEWCLDWYGPYDASSTSNPVGRVDGSMRVLRGGSRGTEDYFLRTANRSGSFPDDRDINFGFRIVAAEMPATEPLPAEVKGTFFQNVQQTIPGDVGDGPDPMVPYFEGPIEFVRIPANSKGPLYSQHNHNPAIKVADNGDVIALWYSNMDDGAGVLEAGRALSVAASRLRHGATEWEPASLFFDGPDRNDHAPLLWKDPGTGRLWWANAYGSLSWVDMSTLLSYSDDHGATWSPVEAISGRGGQSGPVNTLHPLSSGRWLLPLDWRGHTQLFHSDTSGQTWERPAHNTNLPDFAPGNTGNMVWGIHGTMAELGNGDILAFGRLSDSPIPVMPQSISHDGGLTWEYSHSEFPDISYGQRAVMIRLQEGPLLFFSFTDSRPGNAPVRTLPVVDYAGNEIDGFGLYGALSWDDGATWPVKKLITAIAPGQAARSFDGGGWTGMFVMTSTRAEPKGYLTAAQGPDGTIHLASSKLHYRFNFKWLVQNTAMDITPSGWEGMSLW